ncbi:MAG TPA: T9SS type A sorting domain-containing protein, partial [Flavobacterium sp.]
PLSKFERQSNVQVPESTINAVSHFRLNAILNDQYTRQIALAFLPEATDNVDRGIDAKSPNNDDLPNDVYFALEGGKYVIQGINFDVTKRIPVGVKADNNSTFRFYVPEVINFDENQPIYLYDGADGTYHNIKTGFFEVTLDSGIYNDRFEITFMDAALNVPHVSSSDIDVLQDNDAQLLSISNPALHSLTSATLYDMSGKTIINAPLGSEAHYGFPTSSLSEGVYIVKIVTINGEDIDRKISIFRQKK